MKPEARGHIHVPVGMVDPVDLELIEQLDLVEQLEALDPMGRG